MVDGQHAASFRLASSSGTVVRGAAPGKSAISSMKAGLDPVLLARTTRRIVEAAERQGESGPCRHNGRTSGVPQSAAEAAPRRFGSLEYAGCCLDPCEVGRASHQPAVQSSCRTPSGTSGCGRRADWSARRRGRSGPRRIQHPPVWTGLRDSGMEIAFRCSVWSIKISTRHGELAREAQNSAAKPDKRVQPPGSSPGNTGFSSAVVCRGSVRERQ